MKPMAKNTKHKKAESVAETLCSFSGFLCDIVISVYMIVILMVLPLYNKGYARIGTEKETFFLKTMTYGAKALLPVFYCGCFSGWLQQFRKRSCQSSRNGRRDYGRI